MSSSNNDDQQQNSTEMEPVESTPFGTQPPTDKAFPSPCLEEGEIAEDHSDARREAEDTVSSILLKLPLRTSQTDAGQDVQEGASAAHPTLTERVEESLAVSAGLGGEEEVGGQSGNYGDDSDSHLESDVVEGTVEMQEDNAVHSACDAAEASTKSKRVAEEGNDGGSREGGRDKDGGDRDPGSEVRVVLSVPERVLEDVDCEEDIGVDAPEVITTEKDDNTNESPEIVSSDYIRTNGHCHIRFIHEMVFNLRGIDDKHVEHTRYLLEKDFIPEKAGIDVAFVDRVEEVVAGGGKLETEVDVLDGRHRLHALREMEASGDKRWSSILESVPIIVWRRKDGQQIDNDEGIGIGELLNMTSASALKMSFLDKIHSCVSLLKSAMRKIPVDSPPMRISMAAKKLDRLCFMRLMSKRTRERYAQVGLLFSRKKKCFEHFQRISRENKSISITHLSSNELLNSTDMNHVGICLDALAKRMASPGRQNWAVLRKTFYWAVGEIYKGVQSKCQSAGVDLDSVLKHEIKLGPTSTITVRRVLINRMSNFGDAINIEQSILTRQRMVMEKVDEAISALEPEGGSEEDRDGTEEIVQQSKAQTPEKSKGEHSAESSQKKAVSGSKKSSQPSARRRSTRTPKKTRSLDYNPSTPSKKSRKMQTPLSNRRKAVREEESSQRTTRGDSSGFNSFKKVVQTQPERILVEWMNRLGYSVVQQQSSKPQSKTGSGRIDSKIKPRQTKSGTVDDELLYTLAPMDDAVPNELPIGVSPSNITTPYLYDEAARAMTYDSDYIQNPWTPPMFVGNDHAGTEAAKREKIDNVHLYLNACCIPLQHRANIFFDDGFLMRNHRQVWWNISFNILNGRSEEELNRIARQKKIRLGEKWDIKQKLTCLILKNGADHESFFASRAMELKMAGYTLVEGLFKEYGGATRVLKDVERADWIEAVMEDLEAAFEKRESKKVEEYTFIHNSGEETDNEQDRHGVGRYMSTRYGVMEALEQDEKRVLCSKYRALADVRSGMVLGMLQLSSQTVETSAMYCPNTGSRALVTTPGCPRQIIHTDRAVMGKRRTIVEEANPGYFTIITGKESAYVWVVGGSHIMLAKTKQKNMAMLSQVCSAEVKTIPPFSLFIGRGDLQHAGCGCDDYPSCDCNKIRLHNLWYPASEDFPNGIISDVNFQPRFQLHMDETSSSSSEEREEESAMDEGDEEQVEGGSRSEVEGSYAGSVDEDGRASSVSRGNSDGSLDVEGEREEDNRGERGDEYEESGSEWGEEELEAVGGDVDDSEDVLDIPRMKSAKKRPSSRHDASDDEMPPSKRRRT